MKKRLLLIAAILLLIAGGVGVYAVTKKDNKKQEPIAQRPAGAPSSEKPPQEVKKISTPTKACEVLTLEDAKKLLGEPAKAATTNNEAPKDSPNVTISTCTYDLAAATPAQSKSASLLLRIAKNEQGAAQDKAQFGPDKPANSQNVAGYGDTAYWNADFGQLNILKGKNWYVITYGSKIAAERTLPETKQLADLIKPKL